MKNIASRLKKINFVKTFQLDRFTMPVIIAASIAIFLMSNYLLSQFSLRLDLSQGKAYTLSTASKNTLNKLDKNATITFFVSSDIPAMLQPLKREVLDLLQEYDKSSGKIQLKVLDPKTDANAKKQADEAGIQPLPFQQLQQNQYQVTNAYFGVLIEYNNQKEALPQVTEVETLEYNITTALYKLSRKELPRIAIMGYEESFMPGGDQVSLLRQVLSRQFTVESITLPPPAGTDAEPTPTPEKPFAIDQKYNAVLLSVQPGRTFDDAEIAALKTYLNNKGKVIVLMNGVGVEEQLTTTEAPAKLLVLLKEYGLNVQKNLVLSTASELVNLGQQGQSLLFSYPFWILSNQFAKDSSYFSGVGMVSYPWASSVTIEKKKGYQAKELIFSSRESWTQQGSFILDPQQIPQPKQSDIKPFLIAAESKKENGGAVLFIGSSRFIEDRYLSPRSQNLGFVLNVLNDYASAGALSGIRSRALSLFPLPDLPRQMQTVYQYMNIILLPAIFAIYGVVRLYKRNKASRMGSNAN